MQHYRKVVPADHQAAVSSLTRELCPTQFRLTSGAHSKTCELVVSQSEDTPPA